MDMRFPLEEGLVALLLDYTKKAVYEMKAQPEDIKNSANDETGSLTAYINSLLKDRYRRNQQDAAAD